MSLITLNSTLSGDVKVLCSDKYDPVCGSNLVTYKNQCYFDLTKSQLSKSNNQTYNQLKVLYKGECCTPIQECSLEYSPVCDNLNKTHLVIFFNI